MRKTALFVLLSCAAIAGCEQTTEPLLPPEEVSLRVTVTDRNECSVSTLGKSYSSIGQVRGDVPPQFRSTVQGQGYHGLGCWVSTNGGQVQGGEDGDLVILFSGNSFGEPLAVGTYTLTYDILDDTPPMHASVRFRAASLDGRSVVTFPGSDGTLVVEATPSGGRIIRMEGTAAIETRGFE